MLASSLYTIGYEGVGLDDFLTALVASNVAQVIDIRELPLSRRRGFSKKALTDSLGARGIAYVHIKELGDPKPGREAARRGQLAAFRKIYRKHLNTPDAQAALQIAAKLAGEMPSCLLCFERVPAGCHRSIVATALRKNSGFTVTHLEVGKDALSHSNGCNKSSSDGQFALR